MALGSVAVVLAARATVATVLEARPWEALVTAAGVLAVVEWVVPGMAGQALEATPLLSLGESPWPPELPLALGIPSSSGRNYVCLQGSPLGRC